MLRSRSLPPLRRALARGAYVALLFALVAVAALAPDQPAQAYLDPGAASLALQLLLGGAAGALMVGKLYWRRLKSVFKRGQK